MNDKLTTEQLKLIKGLTCSNNIVSMVDEILEFRTRQKQLAVCAAEPIEPNQHAALIAQCEQDKIDYPDFYFELIQYKNNGSEWETVKHGAPSWKMDEYRQHPHRARIIEFHQCSDEDKKRWQWLFKSNISKRTEWINLNGKMPDWCEDVEYRMRPHTCEVTLQNGDVMEYPEPMRKELNDGGSYFLVDIIDGIFKCTWDFESSKHYTRLYSGSIHLTDESAKQHLEVLKAVNAQVAL